MGEITGMLTRWFAKEITISEGVSESTKTETGTVTWFGVSTGDVAVRLWNRQHGRHGVVHCVMGVGHCNDPGKLGQIVQRLCQV